MATFTPQAQDIIDRLAALNYDEPYWNEAKVIEHLENHYSLLGVSMPQVEVADNMVVGYQLARGAARDAAWDAARDAAWGAARGAARDAASAAQFANWHPEEPVILKWITIQTELLKALENGLGFYFPMRDKLILVPIPRMILAAERLHYDHGKAVSWSDGTGFYFLRGVQFEEPLYNKIVNLDLTAEEVLTIPNADQRAAAMSMLRPDRLLKQMKAELIHTGIKGTELYLVKNFMGTRRTEYCMHMKDASTDRTFIEWVEPTIGKQGNADLCQANAFGIPVEDYILIDQEA